MVLTSLPPKMPTEIAKSVADKIRRCLHQDLPLPTQPRNISKLDIPIVRCIDLMRVEQKISFMVINLTQHRQGCEVSLTLVAALGDGVN